MKIVTIMGSPRRMGKTNKILTLFEESMRQERHEIERINVIDCNINPCKECFVCQSKPAESGCCQKDDWNMVFHKMVSADAIVYASPLFCFDITAQMKPLMDRHFSLMNKDLLKGKLSALLITCGGAEEDNADCIQTMFRRAMDIRLGNKLKTSVVGTYIAEYSMNPDFEKRAEAVVKRMVRDFTLKNERNEEEKNEYLISG